jgi:glycosyltransferase involved in cell wall biosynthesis
MKISLCVIAGNESQYIERLLSSFAPAFDELSLVRASGSAKPDDTEAKAQAWCAANGRRCLISEYRNAPDAAGWEHVDDFAAARNAAFAQATGEWMVWADCDDTHQDAAALRRAMEEAPPEIALMRFPYDVTGTGKRPSRERCLRRFSWEAGARWAHPVHENLLVPAGSTVLDHPGPCWVHLPKEVKLANRTRNTRILARAIKDAPMNYFYLHQEHYCARNNGVAEQIAELVVRFPSLDDAFKAEALLNLARITTDREKAFTSALAAHAKMPWCREPLAALVMMAFERNENVHALHWAKLMASTPDPVTRRPWTHEPKWYDWAGDDLLARAYRLNGNAEDAQLAQEKYHAQGQPTFSLCHATRGRTSQALECRDTWLSSATNPRSVEHIFAVDSDDREGVQMSKQFVSVVSQSKTCVAAWNLAATRATGQIFVQLSDDWRPVQGWDAMLLAAIGDRKGEFVLAISDGTRKDDLLCMAILSRERWEKQGREMFSPEYESMYSDNEFSVRAFADGVVIDARDRITFRHLHPAFGSAANDATYAHTNAPDRYARGLETFKRRNPERTVKRMPRFTVAEITMADEFGQAIAKYSEGTKCALEIGGGDGQGSTQCIKSEELWSVENHSDNVGKHATALRERRRGIAVDCNATDPAKWMTADDVARFYNSTPTRLNQYPLSMVLTWLDEDRETAFGKKCCAFAENTHPKYDFVLIDGCPFSAESELAAVRHRLVPGAYIALDDVVDIKNHANYHALKNEPGVRLVWENINLRNGAAIFQLP